MLTTEIINLSLKKFKRYINANFLVFTVSFSFDVILKYSIIYYKIFFGTCISFRENNIVKYFYFKLTSMSN
jgi:hypothetical protein